MDKNAGKNKVVTIMLVGIHIRIQAAVIENKSKLYISCY